MEPLCLFCVDKILICVQGTNKSHCKNNSTNGITYKMVKSNNNDDGCYSDRAAAAAAATPPPATAPPQSTTHECVYRPDAIHQSSSFLLKFCRLHNWPILHCSLIYALSNKASLFVVRVKSVLRHIYMIHTNSQKKRKKLYTTHTQNLAQTLNDNWTVPMEKITNFNWKCFTRFWFQ